MINFMIEKIFMKPTYPKITTPKIRILSGLALAACLGATALAADPANAEFAPNQPHRPANF